MYPGGTVVYSTDRNVPGTRIQLEFTLLSVDGKYLAMLNALKEGKTPLLRQRFFVDRDPKPIQEWTASLVAVINKQFNTDHQGLLRHELETVMVVPGFIPESIATSETQTAKVPPKDLTILKDTWESDPAAKIPRADIVTTLIVRRTKFGILCHLHVEFPPSTPADLPSAAGTVGQIRDWLGSSDTGLYVANRMGMQDDDAFRLCKRWLDAFEKPLHRWDTMPAWLAGKTPPQQLHMLDGKAVQLP